MRKGAHRTKATTACYAAAPGPTTRGTAALPIATTTRPRGATTTTAFALPQLRGLLDCKPMTRWHPVLYSGLSKDENQGNWHASKLPERLPICRFKDTP